MPQHPVKDIGPVRTSRRACGVTPLREAIPPISRAALSHGFTSLWAAASRRKLAVEGSGCLPTFGSIVRTHVEAHRLFHLPHRLYSRMSRLGAGRPRRIQSSTRRAGVFGPLLQLPRVELS